MTKKKYDGTFYIYNNKRKQYTIAYHWQCYRITRRMLLVVQELLTLPEHLSLPPILVGFVYSVFSFMCMFCRSLFVLLAILFSALLGFTDSY